MFLSVGRQYGIWKSYKVSIIFYFGFKLFVVAVKGLHLYFVGYCTNHMKHIFVLHLGMNEICYCLLVIILTLFLEAFNTWSAHLLTFIFEFAFTDLLYSYFTCLMPVIEQRVAAAANIPTVIVNLVTACFDVLHNQPSQNFL